MSDWRFCSEAAGSEAGLVRHQGDPYSRQRRRLKQSVAERSEGRGVTPCTPFLSAYFVCLQSLLLLDNLLVAYGGVGFGLKANWLELNQHEQWPEMVFTATCKAPLADA